MKVEEEEKVVEQVYVIQYEQFFTIPGDLGYITNDALEDNMDKLRELGGARIVGTYIADYDTKFRGKAISYIDVPVDQPTREVECP